MRVVTLGSGSRGNATFVELGGVRMLVIVTRPDRAEPVRAGSEFHGVESVGELL